jgi:hypothetical protein
VDTDTATPAASGMDTAGADRAASTRADPNVDPAVPHVDADTSAGSAAHTRAAAAGGASSATEPAADADRRVVASMADAHAETAPAALPAAGSDGKGFAFVDGVLVGGKEKPCMCDEREEGEARY